MVQDKTRRQHLTNGAIPSIEKPQKQVKNGRTGGKFLSIWHKETVNTFNPNTSGTRHKKSSCPATIPLDVQHFVLLVSSQEGQVQSTKGLQLMIEFHPCTDSQDMSATYDACVSQSFSCRKKVPLNFMPKNEPLVSSAWQAVSRDTS